MIPGTPSCFHGNPQGNFHIYQDLDDILYSSSAAAASGTVEPSTHALFYNLSVLKEKVQQLESFLSMVISPNRTQQYQSIAMGVSGAGNVIQEILLAASSLNCALQQVAPNDALPPHNNAKVDSSSQVMDHSFNNNLGIGRRDNNFFNSEINFGSNSPSNNANEHVKGGAVDVDDGSRSKDQRKAIKLPVDHHAGKSKETRGDLSSNEYDIIELDAADLLAKYTHYCQVCGKGFRRDANLRMHMRAHGDKYKTAAALTNPMKGSSSSRSNVGEQKDGGGLAAPLKYSCPHEGCRWNKKHAKFQPLKSVVCVKNHYKRSHCPKMYVCKRCNLKQFSVLSDLRTHEKHCGDLRWRCSCGTNFSRKDKLMGHVALFVGHTPEPSCLLN